ncbi:trihelix transcription factor GTL2 [Benincasa hispida]|uniref:trihelix transcription factor GTL2 n=1 Tax=Benincasa hispida TaxID=102211 RepID=UPI001902A3E7|nr:trihelix transcription factor GTL2 [Benincasa hispida]
MFEGSVSEQLHQFLTPRTAATPPPPPPNSNSLPLIPLNFALHSPNFNFHPFDSYNASSTTHHQIHLHQPHHFLHHQSPNPRENGNEKNDDETTTTGNNLQVAMDLEVDRENNNNNNRSILMEDHIHHDEWRNDELLALLRIRSNIDNCFHESTWEHVSRKLGEVGFRRTAEKCKEKFEEESRYFNHNINYNKSCRFLTHELNYQHHHHQDQDDLLLIHDGKSDDGGATIVVVPEEGEEEKEADFKDGDGELQEEEEEEDLRNDETRATTEEEQDESSRSRNCKKKKKRKMMRQKEFEILKGYCEEIVKKMMIQQEEIHSKLLQDMLKKEEEKVAKEECWKKEQMERLHKELEVMAHEQAIATDRQATIIEILNQITNSTTLISSSPSKKDLQNLLQSLNNYNNNNVPNSPSSSSLIQTQTSSPNKKQVVALPPHENSSSFSSQNDQIKKPKNPCLSTQILAPQDPNSFINHSNPPPNPKSTRNHKDELDELGKRWPRDEVLALVNVRCNLYNNGDGSGEQGASLKAPLWERISQGMLQLGYKRSAKRCKEKWENINKYFRKTKDVNKKRSLDSRTCPYFHQLTTLYNQGGANKRPENCPIVSPENHSN